MTAKETAVLEKLTESVDALRVDVREVRTAIVGDVTDPNDAGLKGRVNSLESRPAVAPIECVTDRRRIWLAVKAAFGFITLIAGWLILNKL